MFKPHALVVGGTRGLGRAVVQHFAERGYTVSVVSRRRSTDKTLGAHYYPNVDLAKKAQLAKALKQCVATSGPINVLVFAQRFRGTGDVWSGEISTTLTGTRDLIELAQNHFSPDGGKSIVLVGSVAGRYVVDDQPVSYHMAKAAMEQMVRYYAVHLGARGIRVNGVAPASFVKEESATYYLKNKSRRTFFEKMNPLGRMVTTLDIAHVVRLLSDPDCFVTGQILTLDGGASLLWPDAAARRIRR